MAQRKIDVVLDSVRRLIRLGATANLVNLLQKQHPADLAQVFAELGEKDRSASFALLVERNSKLAMEALSELGPEGGAALLADRSAEEIARLLHDLPSDDAAAIIDNLPEPLNAAVVELIEKRPGDEVGELLEYDEQTAGRIMNPKVFALSEDMTAGEAITTLQGSRDVEMVFYLYVVDVRRHLVGVISLRRLLLVSPATALKRIMTTDLTSVRTDTDQEEAARLVASYNLLAIPVVDEENKLVGVITVDDVIDVIKDEATEDVYRLAGMGGNAATQTLTVIVRGIALGELTWANSRKALFKEAAVGLGNGIACGIVGALVVWVWKGNAWLGGILGAAMIINMFVAATAGTLIPLALRAMKIDPALASSVFITTLTDVFGFLSWLGLAAIFIKHLGATG